jgi:hypothetical protein
MNIKRRFTKWYVKKGYKFGYDFADVPVYNDGFMKTPAGIPKAVWTCPWCVKLFLFLFSPSVYATEDLGKQLVDGFIAGMQMGMEAKENGNVD